MENQYVLQGFTQRSFASPRSTCALAVTNVALTIFQLFGSLALQYINRTLATIIISTSVANALYDPYTWIIHILWVFLHDGLEEYTCVLGSIPLSYLYLLFARTLTREIQIPVHLELRFNQILRDGEVTMRGTIVNGNEDWIAIELTDRPLIASHTIPHAAFHAVLPMPGAHLVLQPMTGGPNNGIMSCTVRARVDYPVNPETQYLAGAARLDNIPDHQWLEVGAFFAYTNDHNNIGQRLLLARH